MITRAGAPNLDLSSSALFDAPRQIPGQERREPRKRVTTLPNECCLRCGGLLMPSYTLSMDRDPTGNPKMMWRCINCGDCTDHGILANRRKGAGSAQMRARPLRMSRHTSRTPGLRIGMTR